MSASKDKKTRKEQLAAGYVDKKVQAAEKAAKERRKTKITYSIVAIVLVLVLAFVFIYNSNWPSRTFTAVTIDGEDYTAAQLNYYYSSSYMNFYNTYYDYIASGLFFDNTKTLADQEYAEGMSWRDYFLDTAVQTMTEVQLLCNAAEAEGFVLPAEYEEQYAETVESFKTSWELYGYSSLEQYIALSYGKGATMELLEEELYRNYIASAYSEHLFNSYEYTTDELDAYYAEHADEMDLISYAYVSATDGSLDVDAIAAAVNGSDEDAFTAYMAENYEDEEPLSLTYAGASLNETFAQWLLDASRQPGDAAAFESESGSSYAVMFIARDNNDYNTVSFRHILLNAEDSDGDGVYSDEEKSLAETEAQELLAQWQAGAATEDTFAEFANANSDDTGSNTTGGLYEMVYQDAMVEPVNDWIFAEGRQAGDTGIVSFDGHYTGSHILYFVGTDDLTYAQAQADNTLRNEAYTAMLDSLKEGVEPQTKNLVLCGKNY